MHHSMASLPMVTNNHIKLIGTVTLCTKTTKTDLQTSINVSTDGET